MSRSRRRTKLDLAFSGATGVIASSVLVLCAAIIWVLVQESLPAIRKFGFSFLVRSEWNPVLEQFGGAGALLGTLIVTLIALLIAIPVSLGIAIFVTEVAPKFMRGVVGGAVELLAAIPSVIYGMWGLFTLAPLMGTYIEPFLQQTLGRIPVLSQAFSGVPRGIDVLTAGVVLSIMIVPFIASVARDAFNLTPVVVRESAYATGATQWEVVRDITLPYSRYGVLGGIVLAMGRAIGETMAVAFVLGNRHEIPKSLFDAATTITVTLANEFSEADKDMYYSSLFYLALTLFVASFLVLAFSRYMLTRIKKPN